MNNLKSSINCTIENAINLNKTLSKQKILNLNLSLIDNFNKTLPSNITGLNSGKLMFSLFPFLLKKEDKKYIEEVCLLMHGVVEKIIDIFLHKNEHVFNFYKEYDFLIPFIYKQNNYYQTIVRYDFMINDDGILFYEFNGCLPGGMFIYDRLNKEILKHISIILNRKIATTFNLNTLTSSVFRLLKSNPLRIVLLYDNYNFDCEFKIIQEELESKGVNVEFSHIKNIKIENEIILINGKKIFLAYNNFFLTDFQDNFDKNKWINILKSEPYKKLIKATKNGKLNLINNIAQMTIVEDKSIFALLNHPKILQYFDSQEIKFLSKYVPYTTMDFKLKQKDIMKVIENKDNYIIKKHYSQLGTGVYQGQDYSESQWINILDKNHNKAILQQKIDSFKYPFFDPRHSIGYRYTKTNLSMSMYIVNGQCSGLIAHLKPHGSQGLLQPVFEVM
ncbi:MAG: hypothetical protein ACOC07_04210 [Coleofasciculus sp.]